MSSTETRRKRDFSFHYVTLPSGLRSIGASAFAGSGLRSIDLPETLQHIGVGAFSDCRLLSGSIRIPAGVTELSNTFSHCERVTEVEFTGNYCKLGGSVFDSMYSLRHIKFPEQWDLAGENVFNNCRSLEGEIVMNPQSTNPDLGAHSFFMCTSLSKVVMPKRLNSCGEHTFDYSGVQDVVWPESMSYGSRRLFSFRHGLFKHFFANALMRRVNSENFGGNEQMEAFGLDQTVELHADALTGCNLLKAVYSVGSTPPAVKGGNPFENLPDDAVLYVPLGAKAAYESSEYWNTFGQIVELDQFPEWVVSGSHTLKSSIF